LSNYVGEKIAADGKWYKVADTEENLTGIVNSTKSAEPKNYS
jgi:hypothetical protein